MLREKYQIDIPIRDIVPRLRAEFEQNRGIKDHKVVDVLVFKGRSELEEARNLWKQKAHVLALLGPKAAPASAGQDDILARFLAGHEVEYDT